MKSISFVSLAGVTIPTPTISNNFDFRLESCGFEARRRCRRVRAQNTSRFFEETCMQIRFTKQQSWRRPALLLSLLGATFYSAAAQEAPLYRDARAPVEQRVADLLSR